MVRFTPEQLTEYLARHPEQRLSVAAQLEAGPRAHPTGTDGPVDSAQNGLILDSMAEYDEQCALFFMAAQWQRKVPELEEMWHPPNGGARDKITGARLKKSPVGFITHNPTLL